MSATVVGGAVVEITADLAKFSGETQEQLSAALNSPALRETITEGFEEAISGVGAVGKQAADEFAVSVTSSAGQVTAAGTEVGAAAADGIATGVTEGSAKVTAATEASVTEAGAAAKTKAAEEGAEAGGAFSEGMLENLKGLAAAAVPLLGVLAGGELIKSAVEGADQLEGANIKIENVFGESGDAVKKWADGVSGSLRLSALQAETTAGSFGAFLGGLGVSKEDASGLSEKLTSLTANVAAFNNADPASVQAALQGALKGRTAALKQYGVTLTDAQVQQEALSHATELGLTVTNGTVGPLNTQQKALATLYAVMDATKKQQGALASTSDTLKAKQQVLSAEFENLKDKAGAELLPILAKLAGFMLNDVVPALAAVGKWVQQNQTWLKPLGEVVLGIAAAFLAWKLAVSAWELVTKIATGVQTAFNLVMDANPILLIVVAIAALAVGLIYAYNHSKTFRDIVKAAFSDVKKAAQAVANFFTKDIPAAFNTVVTFLRKWGPLILTVIAPFIGLPLLIIQHWSQITSFFSNLWGDIKSIFSTIINGVVGIVETWYPLILAVMTGGILLIPALIFKYWDQISGFLTTAWNNAIGFLQSVPGKIEAVFLGAVTWLESMGENIITGLWTGIKTIWNNDVTFFENIGSTIEGWFGGAAGWLVQAGEDLIHGLVKGIKNVAGDIGKAIKSAVGDIPGASTVLGDLHVPGFATGGYVTRPTLAMIGEDEPEYIIPKSQLGVPGSPAAQLLASVASKANSNSPATQFAAGPQTVTLDPESVAAISASIIGALDTRPVSVQVGSKTIAKAANTGNKALARVR